MQQPSTLYLLIALNICHWLADYTPLSTPRMLKAKATGKPLTPIADHALVHSLLMTIVVLAFGHSPFVLVYVLIFQFLTHFIIDTLKGKMNIWYPAVKDTTKYFHWVIFGLDQLLHQMVIVIIAFYATT